MNRWSLRDARNRLSEVIEAATRRGPQVVTRRGVEVAVLVTYRDFARAEALIRAPRQSFESFLQTIPRLGPGEADPESISFGLRDDSLE